MYHHVKKLMYTVRVDEADPKFGNMLLEQFGGANGELAAAMQYSIQGLNCDDPERKDLLMDIGTEELSHLEIVGALARLHLKPMTFDRESAEADPLVAIAGGGPTTPGTCGGVIRYIKPQRPCSKLQPRGAAWRAPARVPLASGPRTGCSRTGRARGGSSSRQPTTPRRSNRSSPRCRMLSGQKPTRRAFSGLMNRCLPATGRSPR